MPDPSDVEAANTALAQNRPLDAAQIVASVVAPPDLDQFLHGEFTAPAFKPSEIHEIVYELDPKITVTTNFDDIYDKYCTSGKGQEGFVVCRYHDPNLLNVLRSRRRVIIKAHGCISDAQKIVLSRASYFEARQAYPEFYSILDALFLTHTILFIGCSLEDPDLQLLLQTANIAARCNHSHYALVEELEHQAIASAVERSYNVKLLQYGKGRHEDALSALRDLADQVNDHRAGAASV